MRKWALLLSVLLWILLLAVACVKEPVGRHPAAAVIEEMYVALEADDMNSYMDTMLPDNRRTPNPLMLLKGLSLYGGTAGIQVGFDLNSLAAVSVRDLQVSVVESDGDYALVQAEGVVRYPALAWELPFCDQHDVRRVDGHWYVDVYAPERKARVEQVMNQRLAELEVNPPAADDPADLWEAVGQASEVMFDLCVSH